MLTYVLALLGGQIRKKDRFAEGNGDRCLFYGRSVVLKESVCVVRGDGDGRAAGLLGDFEAAVMERSKIGLVTALVSRSLREDEDGCSVLGKLCCLHDRLDALAHILSVNEEAVHISHIP